MRSIPASLMMRMVLVAMLLIPTGLAQKTPALRVVSYNVLVGFGNHRVGEPYRTGTERRKNIVAWLAEQKADVVALQEMNGFTEEKLRDLAAGWDHPYAIMLKESGYPTALTSKEPIVVIDRRLKGIHHGVMVCRTGGIDFVVVHLWPFKDEKQRLHEIEVALELYEKSRSEGREVVMLGDFNAVSPADVKHFSEAARTRLLRWNRELKDGRPDTSVIQSVVDAGLVDIYGKHRPQGKELPLPRIDFVFASPDLARLSRDGRWRTDPEALLDSDHPAVVADFDYAIPRFPGYAEQDMLDYGLDLHVDPKLRRIEGQVEYRIRALTALDRIFLDAQKNAGWSVSFEQIDGQPLASRWLENRVIVVLPQVAAAGDEIRFRARFEGLPPDGFYFADNRYGEPLAFTDHYSIRARGWLPCEDHPGDRARFEIALRYPDGNEGLASGVPVEEKTPSEPNPPRLRYATKSDLPPYMLAICVGPYARVPEEGDPRLWPHFVYRQDLERAKPKLVHHAAWIKRMEDAFGLYDYGKYTTIQCPTRWGGFEAPGNVLLSERIFDRPEGGTGTLAHELVHMWFGDAVGYAEWREVWLSEGFASYFGPWLHAESGGPTLAESLRRMRDRWKKSRDGKVKSIRWDGFGHPDRALNANTYPKGAWVLHMLRGELGSERFFRAIRDYYGESHGRSVLTSDFIDSIERSSGEKLGWFFEQWLNRVGCPVLKIEAKADAIVVEQIQPGDPYRFRLPLSWSGPDGKQEKRFFRIEGRRTELQVPNAKELVVDPDVELLFATRE